MKKNTSPDTHNHSLLPSFEKLNLSPRLRRDLRSDHAGETGAVAIYQGMLAITKDPKVREFALEHLSTEERHLAFFEEWMPRSEHSRLLPLWRLSGYMLGFTAGVLGRRWVFVTIEAVESFVVKHYQAQLEVLRAGSAEHRLLGEVLAEFQADEDHHRQDAKNRAMAPAGPIERLWQGVIGSGSQVAVVFARAI